MSKVEVQIKGKCSVCGSTRKARAHGGGFVTLKHLAPNSSYRSCDGGTVPPADVRSWVKAQRGDAQGIVDSREQRCEAARVEYEAALAKIDDLMAKKRAEVLACDAVIAKVDRMIAKAGAK